MPITIVGFFSFYEAKYKKEVVDALDKIAAYAKKNEAGTTNYSFFQDSEDELTLIAVEVFADEEALTTHTSSEACKEFFGVFLPILEAGNVTLNQKTSKTDIVAGFGPR